MTDAELEEILKAGEEALENDENCLCHDQTVASVADIVGRAVLHAAAEKIRAAHRGLPAEFWAAKSAGAACANLIDPAKQEQP